jgi:hypothetical protein
MDLFINDKYTCSSKATYGISTEGHSHDSGSTGGPDASIKTITSMSACNAGAGIKVKKGDYMTATAEYNLASHPL